MPIVAIELLVLIVALAAAVVGAIVVVVVARGSPLEMIELEKPVSMHWN